MSVTIEAKYRVVTPMFCAGADPDSAELRLPSFKGVLRFWWRALAWSQYRGDLGTIQKGENALFGSTDTGQSRVLLRLASGSDLPTPVPVGQVLTVPGTNHVVGDGARYLGYGVMTAFGANAGRLTRACLAAPFEFTVQMRARNLDEPAKKLLKNALVALGTLGGMGAKSRKGYGSLVLQSLHIDGEEQWRAPQSVDDLRDAVASLGSNGSAAELPEFTVLSSQARHVLASSDKEEPAELLDLIGRELMRYRSWGHRGKVLGNDTEKNFKDDHDLMKKSAQQRNAHPRRIAFGLPHNYGKGPKQQVGPGDSGLDRRASPLFIHIHQCGSLPVVVLSFLPARFLPKGRSDISVGGTKLPQKPEDELYRPIHDFLNRLLDPNQRKEPFTNAVEVKP